VRQLAAQAEYRALSLSSTPAAPPDQQARLDALLLEAIAALASLLSEPGRTGNHHR
jgi:hypothetical protein